jgi:aminopeptidase N
MLYDNIIYDKAPVMMRMLERTMGAAGLQNGLRSYLAHNFFKNASWDDLLTILDNENPAAGVRQFSDVWVKQKGMPVIHCSYKDGNLIVSQTDPYGRGLCWRQKFQVQVIYPLGASKTVNVDMQQPVMTFRLREKPAIIIPNYNGQGYGQFTLDDEYIAQLPLRLITTRNNLNRYTLLETIHENYLQGKVNPAYFGELYRMMMNEKDPMIMSTAIDHMFKIAFDLTPAQRNTLELCMMDLLGENKTPECRQTIIRKLASNMTSPGVVEQIRAIWEKHVETIFDEHDHMNMAYRLAMLQPDRWQEILSQERGRLQSEDLRKEFDYVSRACNPDATKRTELFNSLLKPENRQQEPWALHALDLLNADIYEANNLSFINASLNSLQYIQQTSDIFFPSNWISTVLAHRKNPAAKQAVEQFLATDKKLPEILKNKVREAAWVLLKQQPYVEKQKPVVVSKAKPKTTTRRR